MAHVMSMGAGPGAKSSMTPRDRFLKAIRNDGPPDRVPAVPDMSNYIPVKRTGLPFWDVYFRETIPLWRAYIDAMSHYGGEWWLGSTVYGGVIEDTSRIERKTTIVRRDAIDAYAKQTTIRTPDGELTEEYTCLRSDPPSPTVKIIKDLAADLPKLKWVKRPPLAVDEKHLTGIREICRQHDQPFGIGFGYPGVHLWSSYVEGGVEQLAYAMADAPGLLDLWFDIDLEYGTRSLELLLSAPASCRPEYICFGGSGTITLASPQLAKKFAIPALKRWSKMCLDAGVATMLHSCGKSRALVDLLAEHTDVQSINPLEYPPMGDVDLAEVKRSRGRRMSLMGNVHTVNVMQNGTPEMVTRHAIRAMHDAGRGGGFLLSTGDQCPPGTPDENLFALIDAARQFGRYDPDTGELPDLPPDTL